MTLLFYAWAVLSACAVLLSWLRWNFFVATLVAIACLMVGFVTGIIA